MGAAPTAVQVSRVKLDLDAVALARATTLLSPDELRRAGRFVFERHARRFVAARAALRKLLGECLDVHGSQVRFCYGPWGKPALEDDPRLQFSMAHCDDVALIAVVRGARVGVDIERIEHNRVSIDAIARSFHPSERVALSLVPPALRTAAFYRCWVRKEALLKATGLGLSGGLHLFAVSIQAEAGLQWSDPAVAEARRWTLLALDDDMHAAALAVETPEATVQLSGHCDCPSSQRRAQRGDVTDGRARIQAAPRQ